MTKTISQQPNLRRRKKYLPVAGPRLKRLLAVVFGLFALLAVNSTYKAAPSRAAP